jgi:hypothetical protein
MRHERARFWSSYIARERNASRRVLAISLGIIPILALSSVLAMPYLGVKLPGLNYFGFNSNSNPSTTKEASDSNLTYSTSSTPTVTVPIVKPPTSLSVSTSQSSIVTVTSTIYEDSSSITTETVTKTLPITSTSTTTSVSTTTITTTDSSFVEMECNYAILEIQGFYYSLNCLSSKITYGGPSNIGSVSGTDASQVIQASVDNISSTGGAIYLLSGTYGMSATLDVPSNVVISGAGPNSTTLFASKVLNSGVIENEGGSTAPNRNSVIEDLSINGLNDSNTGVNGVTWYSDSSANSGTGTYSLLIYNVDVEYMSGVGMNLLQGPTGVGWDLAENSRVYDNLGGGLYLTSPDSIIENLYGSDSYDGPVVYVAGGTDTFEGGYFGGSDYNFQVELYGAVSTTFVGTVIDSSAKNALYVTGSYSDPSRNITFEGGSISNTGTSENGEYPSVDFAGPTNGFVFSGTKFWQTSSNQNLPNAVVYTGTGVSNVVFQDCIIQSGTYVDGVIAPQFLAPNSVEFFDDSGFNPVGSIPAPFTNTTVGLGGTSNQIEPSSNYIVSGVDLSSVVCNGGSGVNITEITPTGSPVESFGSSSFTISNIPIGYEILTNAWSSAPTCSVFGD